MNARIEIRDALLVQKMKRWPLFARHPLSPRVADVAVATESLVPRKEASDAGSAARTPRDRCILSRRESMTQHYCQMRLIGDGIRCDQQPPQGDCCAGRAQLHYHLRREAVAVAGHYDEHMETRGFLRMDGRAGQRWGCALTHPICFATNSRAHRIFSYPLKTSITSHDQHIFMRTFLHPPW